MLNLNSFDVLMSYSPSNDARCIWRFNSKTQESQKNVQNKKLKHDLKCVIKNLQWNKPGFLTTVYKGREIQRKPNLLYSTLILFRIIAVIWITGARLYIDFELKTFILCRIQLTACCPYIIRNNIQYF